MAEEGKLIELVRLIARDLDRRAMLSHETTGAVASCYTMCNEAEGGGAGKS